MANLFEYKIIVSDSDDETDEETLNGHGAQGWELVNASRMSAPMTRARTIPKTRTCL